MSLFSYMEPVCIPSGAGPTCQAALSREGDLNLGGYLRGLCVYVHVCEHVCLFLCVCVLFLCVHVCMCMCVHTCIYMFVCVCRTPLLIGLPLLEGSRRLSLHFWLHISPMEVSSSSVWSTNWAESRAVEPRGLQRVAD